MDVPRTVKSGNSDFSIDRILSEETSSRDVSGTPNWLCCTRYRPPRLPRAVNACRNRRAGRHARVPFTAAQAAALEAAYTRAPYLAPPALRALAAALNLRDDRIKIWFQNRRARERREKCAVVTPPHTVTLPPTMTPWTSPAKELVGLTQDMLLKNLCRSSSVEDEDNFRFERRNSSEGRPESPLDIETVDE